MNMLMHLSLGFWCSLQGTIDQECICYHHTRCEIFNSFLFHGPVDFEAEVVYFFSRLMYILDVHFGRIASKLVMSVNSIRIFFRLLVIQQYVCTSWTQNRIGRICFTILLS
ncbi:hypothetical protein SAY87_015338 [Trapa incisa]|uniref:Secreted protein n=1 Tax=Trapa incisa TaxID=236973 RepID=A0AAN7H3N3_9MYRT|nr:hypothetical protein SAY87_015338 [Trapa incisa]